MILDEWMSGWVEWVMWEKGKIRLRFIEILHKHTDRELSQLSKLASGLGNYFKGIQSTSVRAATGQQHWVFPSRTVSRKALTNVLLQLCCWDPGALRPAQARNDWVRFEPFSSSRTRILAPLSTSLLEINWPCWYRLDWHQGLEQLQIIKI